MKVICVGAESFGVEDLKLAIRFRWPDASFVLVPPEDDPLLVVESEGADLVAVFAAGLRRPVPELCGAIRRFSDIPLLVMGDTKADTSDYLDEVKALEGGADDFIRSPARLPEIVARVVALIRRAQAFSSSPSAAIICVGDLLINSSTYEAYVGGMRTYLTSTEFHLLQLLMRNKGTVVRHSVVERSLWGEHMDSASLVKKYVHRLRRKLEEANDGEHEYIRSVYGIGYLLVARDAPLTGTEAEAPSGATNRVHA